MRVSINQPCYLGWLGYWDRIRRSDLHIVLDHVQFEKGSYTNRCRIKQRDGREMWLTVPVEKGKPINRTRVDPPPMQGWVEKHRRSLEQAYGEDGREVGEWLWDPVYLAGICYHTTLFLAAKLGVPFRPTFSSKLSVPGAKSELVLNLCKEVGATQYLSGPNGRDYLDLPAFEEAGVEVLYHDFPTDGDWGLSAVHHLSRSFTWPSLDLTSAHSSQASAEAGVVAPHSPVPQGAHPTSLPS